MLDHLIAHEGRGFFLVPLYNPDLEAAGAMLQHPLTTIGLGDSGAHTTQTSDSGYPTFALAYWVRERRLMSLERMVHKLTGELAAMWGIAERGVLRRGAFADLNVIDFARLDLRLPEVRHDLPTGAAHLHQSATGYAATVVNGRCSCATACTRGRIRAGYCAIRWCVTGSETTSVQRQRKRRDR